MVRTSRSTPHRRRSRPTRRQRSRAFLAERTWLEIIALPLAPLFGAVGALAISFSLVGLIVGVLAEFSDRAFAFLLSVGIYGFVVLTAGVVLHLLARICRAVERMSRLPEDDRGSAGSSAVSTHG